MSFDEEESGESDTGCAIAAPCMPNDPTAILLARIAVSKDLSGVARGHCTFCDTLQHRDAVKEIPPSKLSGQERVAILRKVEEASVVREAHFACSTCFKYLMKKETPRSAAINGFQYPPVPAGLEPLTDVEEHILAIRLPFQQIVHLGRMGTKGQLGVKGSIINVPVDPDETVHKIIPLLPHEDELCVVNLKRKLCHRRAFASSFVDKEKLKAWGQFLEQSTLYKQHNVVFDASRLDETIAGLGMPDSQPVSDIADDPESHEEMFERLGTIQHTLLVEDRAEPPKDSVANPGSDVIDIAPGENRSPISVVWDRLSEELSFPGIYLGEPRKFDSHTTRYAAMRSEIKRRDRRAARPQAVLYKLNVHLREQMSGRLRHRFRRSARRVLGAEVTKAQILDTNFVANSQKKKLAVPCLTPNSNEYWHGRSLDLFAMVRQLGKPHLFATLSSAEYHWPTLIEILKEMQESRNNRQGASRAAHDDSGDVASHDDTHDSLVDEILSDICSDEGRVPPEEKLQLIREDPIICALYFNRVVKNLMAQLKKKNGVMGRHHVIDYFHRIEYQQRGSPHCHLLLWVNEGPENPLEDVPGAIAFIDSLISCDASRPFAEKNKHNHKATCFKNKYIKARFSKRQLDAQEAHRHCRFHAPFWPSPRTKILGPLYPTKDERQSDRDGDTWEEHINYLKDLRLKIKDVLCSKECPKKLDEVLTAAGCPIDDDYHTYELAIRTGLQRVQVIYKRRVEDRWTNPYMPWVLDIFNANTDCQLVLDVYSLLRYCVAYVTKTEKNHSQLHTEITTLRQEKGFDDRTILKMISSRALRAKETSCQEAAWILLGFALCRLSRKCVFVDTSVPDERTKCPKRKEDLASLPEDSTDIWIPDAYERYANRDPELENVSFAVFVAAFHQTGRKDNKPRRRDRIIRYRRYNENSDDAEKQEDFYRAMCTLHLTWRNEESDILIHGTEGRTFAALYAQHKTEIENGRKRFEVVLHEDIEETLGACVAEEEKEATEAEESRRHVAAGNSRYSFDNELAAEYMDDDAQNVDIDLPRPTQRPNATPFKIRRRGAWDSDTYLDKMRRLNPLQKQTALIVVDGIRRRSEPRLIYIDGPAGTGKSVVAECIANAFEAYAPVDATRQNSVTAAKCMVSAATGKAAYLVGGNTIHYNYFMPVNEESTSTQRMYKGEDDVARQLRGDSLTELETQYEFLYGHIIDEVSLLSGRNLLIVDQRCKEGKREHRKPFGGLWTIILGDFRQLKPIGGNPVYATTSDTILGSAKLWREFEYVELTQNMRQGEDKIFADILTKIGDAVEPLTDEERALIESRFVKENNLVLPRGITKLYHGNKNKDDYNMSQLLEFSNEKIMRLQARDRVRQNLAFRFSSSDEENQTLLKNAENLPISDAGGLPYLLLAVAGTPYKLTHNLATEDGLVNGAVGVLKWVQVNYLAADCRTPGREGPELAVEVLWLRFNHGGEMSSRAAEAELRQAVQQQKKIPLQHLEQLPFDMPPFPDTEDERKGLVPIRRADRRLKKLNTGPARSVTRNQFPLTPTFADTIHSSQGSSYDECCVEYYAGMQNELVYTALTRLRKMSGLFIENTTRAPPRKRCANTADEAPILFKHPRIRKSDDKYFVEKERLRTRRLQPRWSALLQKQQNKARFVYHNANSLFRHYHDVNMDEVIMAADVLLVAETHLKQGEDSSLNMPEVARCDSYQERRGGGVAVFSRLPLRQALAVSGANIQAVSATHADGRSLLVAVLYCRPRTSEEEIMSALHQLLPASTPRYAITVLAADFNTDMRSGRGGRIAACLASKGLIATSNFGEPSTYYGTTIDAMFSNVPAMETQTYQAYYSDHLPLVTTMPASVTEGTNLLD